MDGVNRRAFIIAAATAAVGAALDPARAIWRPGAKTILLPTPEQVSRFRQQPYDTAFRVGDVITIEGQHAVNPTTGLATPHLQQFVVRASMSDKVDLTPLSRATLVSAGISRLMG